MAAFPVEDVERACRDCAQTIGYSNLRQQQLDVVTSFVGGNDVFAILPTGFGKSLCYAILPSVFDRLLGTRNSIVVVITPLTAIINDQVSFSIIRRWLNLTVAPQCQKTDPSLRLFHI